MQPVRTLTEADISEPPCSFFIFQYQAFSDDLNSPVCVPDVMLCETLVKRNK